MPRPRHPTAEMIARQTASLRAARRAVATISAAAAELHTLLKTGLQPPLEAPVEGVLNRLQPRDKVEADPELEDFIRARILTATLAETVAGVAARFPPERRVSSSSVQRWWHRRGKHGGSP